MSQEQVDRLEYILDMQQDKISELEATIYRQNAVVKELVAALNIAKEDVLHFKKTDKMYLYPTLEAIDKALDSARKMA